MSPQEVALKLTENYFEKVGMSYAMNNDFKNKSSVEIYAEVFDEFFKIASKSINENSQELRRLD